MTEPARCPDCGHERPPGASPLALCPFCLLQLGLDSVAAERSPWLDPASWSCRVLNVLEVEGAKTRYLAEQDSPARRLVVLAPLDVTLGREGERSRLEGLLQALVDFDHALAARVFGAVASEAGTVYLVSEHVAGTPVIRHCERAGAGAAVRQGILLSITDVIRAAHDQGIVHGNLTASRVVITTRRGEPTPVVSGFGETLGAGAAQDGSADVRALVELARQLGLDVPGRPFRSTGEIAAWLR